jgi:hypothetical protein
MQENMDAQKLLGVKDLEANRQGLSSYESLSMCCHGARTQIHKTIKRHLKQHEQDPYFQWPMVV